MSIAKSLVASDHKIYNLVLKWIVNCVIKVRGFDTIYYWGQNVFHRICFLNRVDAQEVTELYAR
jgi:hypothetical protein